MLVVYKYRLYPSGEALERLEYNLELARWVYNKLLEDRDYAMLEGRRVTDYDQARLIIRLRESEKPELAECYARMLAQIPRRISASIRGLAELKKQGHRVGPLKYKARGEYNTLEYNQSGFKIDVPRGTLELSKIGVIPVRMHRPLPPGRVKGVTVTRDNGRWYASIQVDTTPTTRSGTGRRVSLRLGVSPLVVDDDDSPGLERLGRLHKLFSTGDYVFTNLGLVFKHSHHYERLLPRLRKAQMMVSRRTVYKCDECGHTIGRRPSKNGRCPECGGRYHNKAGKNYLKAVAEVRRVHDLIEARRNDYLHKISRYYVDTYDDITIIKPDLKKSIQQADKLGNRRIYDAAINKLVQLIEYKAILAGVKVRVEEDKPIKPTNINTNKKNKSITGTGSTSVPAEQATNTPSRTGQV